MISNHLSEIKDRFSIILIINKQDQLLFLKRSEHVAMGPGKWGFPAGHIRKNESPEKCAARELTEEIGNQIKIEYIKRFGPVRDFCYGGVYEVWLYCFLWHGGNIQLNCEHTEFAWVSPEEFPALDSMDGIDEDIAYLDIWPTEYLDKNKLPEILH